MIRRFIALWRLLGEEPVKQESPKKNGKANVHEVARLKLLMKFSHLKGRSEEIEKEWQRIQQDEHDSYFEFQVLRGQNELEHAYKKGIREGIQWCIDRFC